MRKKSNMRLTNWINFEYVNRDYQKEYLHCICSFVHVLKLVFVGVSSQVFLFYIIDQVLAGSKCFNLVLFVGLVVNSKEYDIQWSYFGTTITNNYYSRAPIIVQKKGVKTYSIIHIIYYIYT